MKSIIDNLPDRNLDDGGGPKCRLTSTELIIANVAAGSVIYQQIRNPDASKEAYDSHQENNERKSTGQETKDDWISIILKWAQARHEKN